MDLQTQSSVTTITKYYEHKQGARSAAELEFQEASRCGTDSGIITTTALKPGVVLSVTLLEKDTNDPEYITANRHMEMGLVATSDRQNMLKAEYISKSKLVKMPLFKEFLKSDLFDVGQSVGIMANDSGALLIFINGVNIDVLQSPLLTGDELSAAINIAGRCSRVKIEMFHTECIKLVCLKSIKVKNVHKQTKQLTCGTIVEVKCYPDCKNLSHMPPNADTVWIEEADIPAGQCQIKGLVPTQHLQLVPHEKLKNLDDFSPMVHNCISEKKEGSFSILKIFCVGSPGVGKTSLKHALLGKPPPTRYNSTHLTDKTDRIYATSTQHAARNVTSTSSSTKWVDYGYDQHIMQMACIATHATLNQKSKNHAGTGNNAQIEQTQATTPHQDHLLTQDDSHIFTTSEHHAGSSVQLHSSHSTQSIRGETPADDKRYSSDKTRVLFNSIRNACVLSTCDTGASKNSEEALFEHIFFTDCGGQPQFIDALPTFLKDGMVMMIVIDLSKKLHDRLNFSYHVNGKDVSLPGNYSALTTLQLIQIIAHSMIAFRDAEQSSSMMPMLAQYYMIVATHADKVFFKQKKINDTNRILQKALEGTLDHCIKFDNDENEIIFPISTLNDQTRMSEKIRDKINIKMTRKPVSIPIRWHTFEINIMEYCKEKKRKILTINECLKVASSDEVQIFKRDELIEVIKHYHQVNFFLYFESFLPDFVFCDSQLILDIISCLLKASFSKPHLHDYLKNPKHLSRLRENGIFNVHILKICSNQVLSSCEKDIGFDIKNIIKILEKLNFMAEVSTNQTEFFLPLALQSCDEKKFKSLKQKFNHGSFDPLLLFPGSSKKVPLGLFASIIVCILHQKQYLFINQETKQYNNAITLEYVSESNIKEELLVCNEIDWIEIRYPGYESNDAHKIYKIFTDIIPRVCETLPYDHHKIAFSYGFCCYHEGDIWPLSSEHKTDELYHSCKVIDLAPHQNSPIMMIQCMQDTDRKMPLFIPELTRKNRWFTEDQLKNWLRSENEPVRNHAVNTADVVDISMNRLLETTTQSISLPQGNSHNTDSIQPLSMSSSELAVCSPHQSLSSEQKYPLAAENHELVKSETETKRRINLLKRAKQRQKSIQFRNESYKKIYTALDMLLEECRDDCINHLEQLEQLQQDDGITVQNEEETQRLSRKSRNPKNSSQAAMTQKLECFQKLLDSQLQMYLKTDEMIEDMQNLLICTEKKEQLEPVIIHDDDKKVDYHDRFDNHQKHFEEISEQTVNGGIMHPSDDQNDHEMLHHCQDHTQIAQNVPYCADSINLERRNSNSKDIPYYDLEITDQRLNHCQPGFIVHVGRFRQSQMVAIKRTQSKTDYHTKLLDQEINTMSKLNHPNIIRFIGIYNGFSTQAIVMEMIKFSLKEFYEQGRLTDTLDRLSIVKDVAAGLYYLQRCRIIHRNITSSNILLAAESETKWRAKISEFGSAITRTTNVTHDPITTCEDFSIGTAVYCAPEILHSLEEYLTTKVDIYSFGVLTCEVFCSEYPDKSKLPIMKQSLTTIHPEIEQLIDLCILTKPENRPAAEMIIAELDTELRLGEWGRL